MTTSVPPDAAPADTMTESLHIDGEKRSVDARTLDALQRNKREGVELAVRARVIGLGVTAVMLLFFVGWPEVLWYHFMLILMIMVGLAQRQVARVGQSRAELLLLAVDIILFATIMLMPNPMSAEDWPMAMPYHFDTFQYFYILLAAGTLAYSWRTLIAIGNWTAIIWMTWALGIWYFATGTHPEFAEGLAQAFPNDPFLAEIFNPDQVDWERRFQEVILFVLVAYTLGVTVRRSNNLLMERAASERERANLARYFSPNVVEELSQADGGLGETRTHNVAVMFVDLVGFTAYAAKRPPERVIETLRDFHAEMEAQVFAHDGTLDKYLGDGLMATFGTPRAGPDDASRALTCARDMVAAVDRLNDRRAARGEPALKVSIGLDYGPITLGDIGANRLEFAVIGNTVNVASRVERLTRPLGARVVLTGALRAQVAVEAASQIDLLADLAEQPPQSVAGVADAFPVWTLP